MRTPVIADRQLKREEEPRVRVSHRRSSFPELAAMVLAFSHDTEREWMAFGSRASIRPSIERWMIRSEPAMAAVSPVNEIALSHNVVSSLPMESLISGRVIRSSFAMEPMKTFFLNLVKRT